MPDQFFLNWFTPFRKIIFLRFLKRIDTYFGWSVVSALVFGIALIGFRYSTTLNEIERIYLAAYFTNHIAQIGNSILGVENSPTGYSVYVVEKTDELQPQPGAFQYRTTRGNYLIGEPEMAFEFPPTQTIWYRVEPVDDQMMGEFLVRNVFDGRPFWVLFIFEIGGGCALFLVVGVAQTLVDYRANRRTKIGYVEKGMTPLNIFQYRKILENRGDFNRPNLKHFLAYDTWNYDLHPISETFSDQVRRFRFGHQVESFPLPTQGPNSFIEVMGDTGVGKSQLIMNFMDCIQDHQEFAIVLCLKPEMIEHYYRPDRGDIILNPQDARCAAWNLAEDIENRADAAAIASIMVQDEIGANKFFSDTPKLILEELLFQYRPQASELVSWCKNESEIDRRLQGTGFDLLIDPEGKGQRAGILASLWKEVAFAFRDLPQTGKPVTCSGWAKRPKGWIFIGCRQDNKSLSIPIISIWLNLLISKLIAYRCPKPVWLVLDELPQLRRLPALEDANFIGRSSGLNLILGFQGVNQIKKLYGDRIGGDLLSQPYLKFIFSTSEPAARKWASELIGQSLVVRQKMTVQDDSEQEHQSITYAEDSHWEPVVHESEIKTLEKLNGIFTAGEAVVKFRIDFKKRRVIAPGFIPKKIESSSTVPHLISGGRELEPAVQVVNPEPESLRKSRQISQISHQTIEEDLNCDDYF